MSQVSFSDVQFGPFKNVVFKMVFWAIEMAQWLKALVDKSDNSSPICNMSSISRTQRVEEENPLL